MRYAVEMRRFLPVTGSSIPIWSELEDVLIDGRSVLSIYKGKSVRIREGEDATEDELEALLLAGQPLG